MADAATVETVLAGQARDLGDGFVVERVLPQIARRTVGPFVFFDRFGPTDFAPANRATRPPARHWCGRASAAARSISMRST